MSPAEELVGRLASHATQMANVATYEEAADAAAQAMLDFLPMDSVVQVRLSTDGTLAVGARRGPLGERLAELSFDRVIAMAHLPEPGAVWQSPVSLDDPEGSLELELARTGARSAVITGYNGLGRLRGVIVLASRESVTMSPLDIRTLELLSSLSVSVLRAMMLVPSLRRHAATDPLTGLWHHGAFSEALTARRNSDRHALIIVDIDHFKDCNDRLGHSAGDEALKRVAAALSEVLRHTDSVFRIGGDEFAALVDVDSPAAALEMGRRMHDAVRAADAGISVSVGVALGRRGESDTELRDRADAALYRVKAGGRDGVAIDEPPATYHAAA